INGFRIRNESTGQYLTFDVFSDFVPSEALTPRVEGANTAYILQDLSSFGRSWQNGNHIIVTGAAPGDRLILTLPTEANAAYELSGFFTKSYDFGRLKVFVGEHLL